MSFESSSYIGVTLLVFKIVGKEPHVKERLNKTANWSDISFFINFKILIGMQLSPEAFWEFRAEIIEIISFLSVGHRKKDFKFNGGRNSWNSFAEYLIEDWIFRAMFEKYLLKAFAISKGLVTVLLL